MRNLKTLKKKYHKNYSRFTIIRVLFFFLILKLLILKYTKKVKVSVVLYSRNILAKLRRILHKPGPEQILKAQPLSLAWISM